MNLKYNRTKTVLQPQKKNIVNILRDKTLL